MCINVLLYAATNGPGATRGSHGPEAGAMPSEAAAAGARRGQAPLVLDRAARVADVVPHAADVRIGRVRALVPGMPLGPALHAHVCAAWRICARFARSEVGAGAGVVIPNTAHLLPFPGGFVLDEIPHGDALLGHRHAPARIEHAV